MNRIATGISWWLSEVVHDRRKSGQVNKWPKESEQGYSKYFSRATVAVKKAYAKLGIFGD